MNNLVIYAAGPVDLGQDVPNWRAQLMTKLNEKGVSAVLFDPATAYKTSAWGTKQNLQRSKYIEEINWQALRNANVFVVCLPKDVPSVGTPIELDIAERLTKKVILLTDIKPGKSVYVDNRVPSEGWFITENLHDDASLEILISDVADALFRYDAELQLDQDKKVEVDE